MLKFIILFSSFVLCLAKNNGQEISKQSNKISLKYDSLNNKYKVLLLNEQIIIPESSNFSISPDSQFVAIIYYAARGQEETKAEIISFLGVKHNFNVDPLGSISISNKGDFVVYGSEPSDSPLNYTKYSFYQSNGKKTVNEVKMGVYAKCKFFDNNYFMIIGESSFLSLVNEGKLKYYLFDSSYKIIISSNMTGLNKLSSISNFDFDKIKNMIHIEIISKSGIDDNITQQEFNFDLFGNSKNK